MNETPIELRGIVKSYGKKQVLCGLDLSVPKGSVVGLLGTNGSGKTTLARLIAKEIKTDFIQYSSSSLKINVAKSQKSP